MIVPIRTDSPLRNTPYMNWALIALNLLAFVLQEVIPGALPRFELHPLDPSVPAYFSYAFLHGGVLHLLSNMLFLYIFGNNVNDKMGDLGYLAFYLAGGVFAGVGYVLTADGGHPVIGASGAVAAVTGAYLVLFPRSTITVVYVLLFIGQIELPCFWFILFFFTKDLIGLSGQDSGVAHNAHVFGTVFGFAVSFVLLAVHLLPRDQFDVLALAQRWNKRRKYRELVSKGYNPFDYTATVPRDAARAPASAAPDPTLERAGELRSLAVEAVTRHDLPRAGQLFRELIRLDPVQVLPRQAQLDVANYLAGQQLYTDAAEAYEQFLRQYPKFEQLEQVQLMLGLIYARYLAQYGKAKEHLLRAAARLHGERELEMARTELARIEPMAGVGGSAA